MKFHTAFTAALFSLKLVTLFAAEISIKPDGNDQKKTLGSDNVLTCIIHVEDPKQISNFKWLDHHNVTIDANYRTTNPRIHTEFLTEDNTQLQLFINNLKREDAGRYTCVANYGNQSLVKSVSIDVYLDQSALIGTRYKMRCQVEAHTPTNVKWTKNGGVILEDPRYSIEDDGLVIDWINESDEGEYRCETMVLKTGQISYRNIRLEVTAPPRIVNLPEYQRVTEGERAQLKCEATGKPKPTITWSNSRTRQIISSGTDGVLYIEKIIRGETIDYMCKAENKAGEDARNIHLNVNSKPDIFEVKNDTAVVGGFGQIQCHVYANPKPAVVIRKLASSLRSESSNDDQYRITVETIDHPTKPHTYIAFMNFSKVELTDDGFYECIAVNAIDYNTRNAHFTVGYAPIIDPKINVNTTFTQDRRPVNLTCAVEAIPNATINWYFNNIMVIERNDSVYKIFSKESPSTLQVTPLDRTAYGIYRCRADNKFGRAEWNINLKEASPPSPVNNFEVNIKSETDVIFKIHYPVGGVPISNYVVQYKMEDEVFDEAKNKTWKRGEVYSLHNLASGKKYFFRLAAINEVGFGRWGRMEKIQMSGQHSSPSEPVIMNIMKEGAKFIELDTATSLELRWKIPSGNGGNVDYYNLKYCVAAEDAESSVLFPIIDSCVEKNIDEKSTSYKIKDLNPDTYYFVLLRAHNQVGDGPSSERYFKTSNK